MNIILTLLFLFSVGAVSGWIVELLFRRFLSSSNPERKWINPGFCIGPYLPIYGFGLCILYLIASLEKYSIIQNPYWNKALLFAAMSACMTLIEYIGGIYCLKVSNVRLWDYSNEWGNIQGIICPKFSLIWALVGAAYYFLIHPHILGALSWLSNNLAFSFVIGLFYGIFFVDLAHSTQLIRRVKQFAVENEVIVKLDNLKMFIRRSNDKNKQKHSFMFPLHAEKPLSEYMKDMKETFEKKTHKNDKKRQG